MSQRSAYFNLAVDLVRSRYGTIPHHFFTVNHMTFKRGDRVTVPAAGQGKRLNATVVYVNDSDRPAVTVQVDGDAPEQYEGHQIADVQPLKGTYHDHDHDADWPQLCEVCGSSCMTGMGNYCSAQHRDLDNNVPTAQELASN